MDSHRYSSSDEERYPSKNSKSRDRDSRRRSTSRSGSVGKSYRSQRHSPDRASPPYGKYKEDSSRRLRDDRKYYDHHKSYRREKSRDRYSHRHDQPRSRSPSRSKKSRSRSQSRSKRSRSRSPRSERRSHKEYSPKRSIDYDERSPRRKYEAKSNKLSILEKMGIDVKVPENEKEGTSSILPNYYNPLAVNPVKYAEQLAKRKLLWNNKTNNKQQGGEATKNLNIWQGAKFSQDQDGKLTAKFQRLMGMKEVPAKGTGDQDGKVKDLFKKQEELFSSMEMQYEVARATTHTQRGVGLGFGPRHIP